MRVVSLLASATEIVCGLQAGDELVARSHECDNPGWVRHLPACTSPAFDITLPSRQIDDEVRRRLRAGEPLYHVDARLIDSLEPDLIIAQAHCEVCAVTPGDVDRAGCDLSNRTILALQADSVSAIYDSIRAVARSIGRPDAGECLVTDMQRRIERVSEDVSAKRAPTVVVLEWIDPVFVIGNWTPSLVEAAGGRPLLAKPGEHSTATPWERVVETDPDFLIVAPCGFDLARTAREVGSLFELPGWLDLTAVRAGRVAIADGNLYFNRSGTTIVETVEILASILHGREAGVSIDSAWRLVPGLEESHPVLNSRSL